MLVPSGLAQNAANTRVARLSRADGDVGITPPGNAGARAQAVANMPMQQGDTLSTGDGMAEVEFDDGATAFLNQNSQLEFTRLAQSATGLETQLTLQKGSATFSGTFTNTDTFLVSTITFQAAVPATAEFRMDIVGDGASVQALSGSISVTTKSGSISLDQGQSLAVHLRDLDQPKAAGMAGPDDFDAWVASMAGVQLMGRGGEMRFWSPPVYYGYSDLAVFGNWINFPGLGMCWRPYGGANWQPYLNGTWRLDPRLGLIWVSFEPWGWLPYHYGSWEFAPGGWLWVPGEAAGFHQWWPARVHWLRNGEQVGWVAMSPRDTEGAPANLAHGIITPAVATHRNAVQPNELHLLEAKQLRGVARLDSPPNNLAASALPPATILEKRTFVQSSPSTGSLVYDPQTRTYSYGRGSSFNNNHAGRTAVSPQFAPNALYSQPIRSLANPAVPLSRQLGLAPRLPAATMPSTPVGSRGPTTPASVPQPHPSTTAGPEPPHPLSSAPHQGSAPHEAPAPTHATPADPATKSQQH